MSKSSLKNVLSSVLSVGNAEQNMAYPPEVFDHHYNIATAFLIDNLVLAYPNYVDALLPFIKTDVMRNENGVFNIPKDYRNHLGFSISVKPSGGNCEDPEMMFRDGIKRSGCLTVPVQILDKTQWDYRTTSRYAYPTHENPIGIFEGEKIRVCPFDVQAVQIMYVRKELTYKYGYIVQPDDTYIYNELTSEESEWKEPAFEFLFKAVFALYSAWSRDNAIMDYSGVLNKLGLF